MKGLLIISLACLAFVSAADKKPADKKEVNKRSYDFSSGDIVPAVQYPDSLSAVPYSTGYSSPISFGQSAYSAPISSVGSNYYPTAYSSPLSTVGLSSYSVPSAPSYSVASAPSYSIPSATSYSVASSPSFSSAAYPTVDSGFHSTAYSAPISSFGSSFYQTPDVHQVRDYKVINKAVPVYVPKAVPYEVTKTVKVPTPYTVHVTKPYSVPVKVKVPVEIPKPYEVKIEHRVPVPVPERVPIEIPRPYPVYKTKEVQVEIEKPVYVREKVEVRYPVPKPYPVEVPTAVRVKVPQRVLIKDPQIVESGVGSYDRSFSVPSFVYGNSYGSVNVPSSYQGSSSFPSLSETKSLEDSISSSIQDHAAIGQSLSQLSEQSFSSSQTGYDQAVQGLDNHGFEGLHSDFGTDFSQNLDTSSIGGLQSYDEYRRTHQADGVINDEKESITVESKSSVGKDSIEERSGGEESVVSDTPSSTVDSETSTSTSEETGNDESTVPSKTTDIV